MGRATKPWGWLAISLLALGACGDPGSGLSVIDIPPDPTANPREPRSSVDAVGSRRGIGPGLSPQVSAMQGYTLYCIPAAVATQEQRATLIDMDGNVVHAWNIVGMPVVMLPGGSIIGARGQRGGGGVAFMDTIETVQVSWDSDLEFSFSEWDDDGTGIMMSRQHHDLQRQGNPVSYYAPGQSALAEGKTLILGHKDRMLPSISNKLLQDDVIYEVAWNGSLTGFTWYAADHIDDMGFDEAARTGIYQFPNWSEKRGAGDWLHINSMATLGRNRWYEEKGDSRFHPDNIIISAREANFIAIISRQTGRIVWRVGPDMSANQPGGELGQLVGQHHAHMIPYGLPGGGNILVFDNGGTSGYGGLQGYYKHTRLWSRVLEFDPVTLKKVWQYGSAGGPDFFFAFFLSSAQRLPNGNTLIANGSEGILLEITRDNQVVWKHELKTGGLNDDVYRAFRVPPEWLPGGFNPANYPPWESLSF